MNSVTRHRGRNILTILGFAAISHSVSGATKTYIGTTGGHFNVSSNWMPTAPANGDDVTLGTTMYTATDDLDVTLNTTVPDSNVNDFFNSLTLDSAGLRGYMVLNQTAGMLRATTETIGKTTSENTFNQNEGTTNYAETLNIGGAGGSDTYNLSGTGNFSDTNLYTVQMNVGISGAGTFTETGGNQEATTVTLGVNSGGTGTVNLSGSQSEFEVTTLNVGGAGSGIFNQSNGSDVEAQVINITSTSGTAAYNYSGGTIETQGEAIQVGTNGTFNLETGAVLTVAITLNSGGVLAMGGGSFDPTNSILYMNGGSFEIQGHNTSLVNLSGPIVNNNGTVLGTGNIINGAATPATWTLDVPYTVVSQTDPGQVVQFGGNIFDGAAGSLGLAVTGGAKFGVGLSGSNTYSGPTTVSATLQAFANGAFSPNSDVTMLAGGVLDASTFAVSIGSLAGTAGTVNVPTGGTLTIGDNTSTTYSGVLTGGGTLIKTGGDTLTLAGTNTGFTGGFTVGAGTLIVEGQMNTSSYSIAGGATLLFSNATITLGSAALQPSAGGGVQYSNATINGGFLRGPGTHTILAGGTSTFNGTTTFNSAILTQNGPAILNDFTNGGTINNNATLTLTGALNEITGVMNINSTAAVQDFGNSGVINIAANATLTNSLSSLVLGGGSRTYIGTTANHGGTLTLAGGTTLEVNGALLVNDGTISGTTDVNYGGTAEGVGTYGPVNVTFGGVFQPGISSTSIIAGNSTIVSALSGDGTVDNVAAAGNITLKVNTTIANSFSGTIQNSNGSLGLNLVGSGSLTLLTHPVVGGNSINTYTGGTTITSGSLIIGAVGAFPAGTPVLNNGSFFIYANSTTGQITGNGQLTIGSVATGNAIATIAPKSGLSTLASLTLTPGSKLDLTNNDLVIHTGSFAQIVSQLAQGYSAGTWTGSTGITSSVAALSTNHATTLGVATGLTTFDGQSVLPSDFLIKYTWLGDANLDGIVNSTDLSAISPTGTTWSAGDFNYDGTVNADDYALFQLGAIAGGVNISTTLPEPTVSVLASCLLLASPRRSRR